MNDKRPTVVENIEALIQQIEKRRPRIITVDGRDGSGKSYLGVRLQKQFGGTLIREDDYREASLAGHFVPKFIDLIGDIRGKKPDEPIIYESCFMQAILPNIGVQSDLSIYIKSMSPMGQWSDEDELACLESEAEAVTQAKAMGANSFRIQMIEYHYRYKPYERADIIYQRTPQNDDRS
jgi:cytidylate kinase